MCPHMRLAFRIQGTLDNNRYVGETFKSSHRYCTVHLTLQATITEIP